ncbi:hypothetical protein D3C86_1637430 [compost metagenome]
MNELRRLVVLAAITRIHAPRLEIAADGARRNFAVGVLARQPNFQIVGLARAETHIAGAQRHGAEMQAKTLQHFFGAGRHALMLGNSTFRIGDGNQFAFPELVLAQHAARITAGRTCFRTEGRRQRGKAQRQFFLLKRFGRNEISQRHFGRRNKVTAVGRLEQIFLELRQLAGAIHGLGLHHQR